MFALDSVKCVLVPNAAVTVPPRQFGMFTLGGLSPDGVVFLTTKDRLLKIGESLVLTQSHYFVLLCAV